MIKHICVCDLCETEKDFDESRQLQPEHWHTIHGFVDNGQNLAHICPSCWKELQECAEAIHERECYH